MRKFILLFFVLFAVQVASFAKKRLPALIGDNMVLQQNTQANIWGWSNPGKTVTVSTSWNNKTYSTQADKDGQWLVKVETTAAGGPYHISINDGEKIELNNIMLGEVWICSGQSNMDMALGGNNSQPVANSLETILTAGKYKEHIRYIKVPKQSSDTPLDNFEGMWEQSTPDNAYIFSAVAYHFARYLTEALDVPVGIICSSWGGSCIESWMDVNSLSAIEAIDITTLIKAKAPQRKPAALYNGMFFPLKNYTAQGILWYQGEANRRNYEVYTDLMASMVKLWRNDLNGELPFYYVQIAPFRYEGSNGTSAPLLVEAQMNALKVIPKSGIAPTNDIGDERYIHPADKQTVGLRLANLALTKTYGIGNLPSMGPIPTDIKFENGQVIVLFDDVYMGLIPRHKPIVGFEIAGSDKVFYTAEAKLNPKDTKQVIISSSHVKTPVAVRYAFRNYIPSLNLSDTFGLPAYPFRSDTWNDIK